ncbi:MAG TPA: GNAT family N-acetyltransferase, partial [Acidimicrobiales bacterium]
DGSVEAAFLVEDAWFRRGIGRALFRALVIEARRHALTAVVATIQSDNDRAARFLRAMAPGGTYELTGPETVVTLPVGAAGRAAAGDLPATEAA